MNNKFRYCPIENNYLIGTYSVKLKSFNIFEISKRLPMILDKNKGKNRGQIINEAIVKLSDKLYQYGIETKLTDRQVLSIMCHIVEDAIILDNGKPIKRIKVEKEKRPTVIHDHWYSRMAPNIKEVVINFACMTRRVRDVQDFKNLKESAAQRIVKEEVYKFYGNRNLNTEIRKTYSISPMNIEHLINWMNGKPNKFSDGENDSIRKEQ